MIDNGKFNLFGGAGLRACAERGVTIKTFLTILPLTISIAVLAQDYNPPQIIGELRGVGEDSLEFTQAFCWAGGQNGDGYDDLLVLRDGFYNYPGEERHSVNAVKLYFGGEEIDNTPDGSFTQLDRRKP